ncbi:uncharacterized protein EI97DRAFT_158588 [Westerdykella ornata]|uniref:Uncharacterized protein n=1 Tax=Westerdykella ornata TaxID=318751 RepID=A0A6A6JAM7_WESOR|nr:uncharacterized protein EI97DRAFT_158588 [Westerdykella ornata]KAF2273462.1 hypothetical protein EI97DRAFT_158588 [Westerdykella ornata]
MGLLHFFDTLPSPFTSEWPLFFIVYIDCDTHPLRLLFIHWKPDAWTDGWTAHAAYILSSSRRRPSFAESSVCSSLFLFLGFLHAFSWGGCGQLNKRDICI